MAEAVKLSRAKVTTLKKGSEKVLDEYKIEGGACRFTFKVETRVNDRVDNSPRLFRRCSYYVKTTEEQDKVRNIVKQGALLEVEGQTNRKSFEPKDGGDKVYYDEIDVKGITNIQPSTEEQAVGQDDLPF